MRNIGIQANTEKALALSVAKQAFALLEQAGANPVYDRCTAHAVCADQDAGECDQSIEALLVIGGDGTMLRSARRSATEGIPLLGVNLGKKGFLTEVDVDALSSAVGALVGDEFTVEERMMLHGEIGSVDPQSGEKQTIRETIALNDMILFKERFSHTLNVEVSVNEKVTGLYACDGIIISTPTGSTAYSLSAGGPVVAPYVNGILITLICPHSLSARPILVGDGDVLSFSTHGANSLAQVSADGYPLYEQFDKGNLLTIQKAAQTARFIHVNEYNFFDLVFKKLF